MSTSHSLSFFSLCLTLHPTLHISPSVALYLFLSVSRSICLCLWLFLILSLTDHLSLYIFISPSAVLLVSLALSLFPCLSQPVFFFLYLYPSLSLSIGVPLSVRLSPCVSLSSPFPLQISLFPPTVSLSLSLILSFSLSLSLMSDMLQKWDRLTWICGHTLSFIKQYNIFNLVGQNAFHFYSSQCLLSCDQQLIINSKREDESTAESKSLHTLTIKWWNPTRRFKRVQFHTRLSSEQVTQQVSTCEY